MKIVLIKETIHIVAIVMAIGLTSCGNGTPVQLSTKQRSEELTPMKYTIYFTDDFAFSVKSVNVFECTENGDKIYRNAFVSGRGESKTFTAQPETKKVKVYLSLVNPLEPFGSGYNGWLPLVYYLSPNGPKIIQIDNHVQQIQMEP